MHYPTHFLIPQAYLQSLDSRTLTLFTTAAQILHQWRECHAMSFGHDDVWTNPFNDATRGPRGGAGVRTPAPWKITNSIDNIYKYAIRTPPPGKSWTPWKFWTVLLHGISESYSLMIVFFEKAMITGGLPLQNKLWTYKKEEKTTSEFFFSQSGLNTSAQ